MPVPTLLYGCENFHEDKQKIQAAEMELLRKVKGWTRLDKLKKENIKQDFDVYALKEKIDSSGEIT